MARNDLYVHRTTFCSHACPSDHCETMLTKLRSRHWVPSSLYLRQRRRNADLHVGAGWDRLERGFGISRASMSHPLPLSRVTTTELAH